MNLLVAVFAVLTVVAISMVVGLSIDTERQHRVLQDIAEERRKLNAERVQLVQERPRLVYERRKLAEDQAKLDIAIRDPGRCPSCPLPIPRRD
jgi:hypothetical protein